eukprot:s7135_g5.t1
MCDGDGANDHDGHIVVDGDEHEDEDIDDDAGGDRSGGSDGASSCNKTPPQARKVSFQLRREGTFGSRFIGGCQLSLAQLAGAEVRDQVLPLWEGTKEVGRLRLSLAPSPGAREPSSVSSSAPRPGLTNLAALRGASLVNHSGAVNAGGLLNRASASEESETRPGFARGASGLVNCAPPAASSGLRNVVESIPQARSSSKEAAESRPSFARGASQGLANLAVREDGSRPTAVPHALELLAEVPAFDPGSDVHKRKLAQALESLRLGSSLWLSIVAGDIVGGWDRFLLQVM